MTRASAPAGRFPSGVRGPQKALGRLPAGALVALGAATAWAAGPASVQRRGVRASDGVRLALYRYEPPSSPGTSPAIVLVTDLGFSSRVFDHDGGGLARALAGRGLETYAFDPRGCGLSETPPSWGLADLAERDLAAALDAVDAPRVVLVGWGFGGTLAIAQAASSPRVAGVVALAPPLALEVPNPVVARWIEASAKARGFVGLPGTGPGAEERRAFALVFAHGSAIPEDRIERIRRGATGRLSSGLVRDLVAWMRTGEASLYGRRLRDLGAALKVPVLLVFAVRDNWTHPEFAEPWRDAIPGPPETLVVGWLDGFREDHGHLGMVLDDDAVKRLAQRIAAFVRERIDARGHRPPPAPGHLTPAATGP